MNLRVWVYTVLQNDIDLTTIVGSRVYAANTRKTVPETPHLIYRLGIETPRNVPARNSPLQVWAHDRPGDYTRVDDMLEKIRVALGGAFHNEVFAAEWIENSQDLVDDEAGTITRWARFQVVRVD